MAHYRVFFCTEDTIPLQAMALLLSLLLLAWLLLSTLRRRGSLPASLASPAASAALSVAAVVIFFAVMEGVCRSEERLVQETYFRSSLRRPSGSLFWELTPGARGTVPGRKGGKWEGKAWSWAVNGQGFRRDAEVSERKEPGEIRILALGDSTTFGYSVDGSETFCHLLEKRLSDALPGRKVTVVNGGVPGYCFYQSLLFFREKGLPLAPDVVIVKDCGNQAVQWSMMRYFGRDELSRVLPVKSLLNGSAFYRYLKRTVGYDPRLEREPPAFIEDGEYREFNRGILEEFIALCSRRKVKMLYLSISLGHGSFPRELHDLLLAKGVPGYMISFYGKADRGVDDPVHPGPRAHRRIAETLTEILAPLCREITDGTR